MILRNRSATPIFRQTHCILSENQGPPGHWVPHIHSDRGSSGTTQRPGEGGNWVSATGISWNLPIYTGWWCNSHLGKYESQWEGLYMIIPYIMDHIWKYKMFETTNQYRSCPYGGFHKWGTPLAGWFIRANPKIKWMMTGGTHIYENHHIN